MAWSVMSTVSNARLIEKRTPLITAQRAPPDATDVLNERPDALLADETTTAVAKPAPALLLDADEDATRLEDRERARIPAAFEVLGMNASTSLMALAAPRAGAARGTEGCEPDFG